MSNKAMQKRNAPLPPGRRVQFPDGFYKCWKDGDQTPTENPSIKVLTYTDTKDVIRVQLSTGEIDYDRTFPISNQEPGSLAIANNSSTDANLKLSVAAQNQEMRYMEVIRSSFIRKHSEAAWDHLKRNRSIYEGYVSREKARLKAAESNSLPSPSILPQTSSASVIAPLTVNHQTPSIAAQAQFTVPNQSMPETQSSASQTGPNTQTQFLESAFSTFSPAQDVGQLALNVIDLLEKKLNDVFSPSYIRGTTFVHHLSINNGNLTENNANWARLCALEVLMDTANTCFCQQNIGRGPVQIMHDMIRADLHLLRQQVKPPPPQVPPVAQTSVNVNIE